MKFAALLTPNGRKATAQLAMDLTKITGKVAVAGTAGLVSTLASAAAMSSVSSTHDEENEYSTNKFGWNSENPGGSPRSEDPEWY